MSFLNRFLPEQPQDDVLQSVVRNLLYLLNSRRGFGSLLCDFGTADYLRDLGGRSAAQTLLREITETIQTYEPRLRVLSLQCVGRDSSLRLYIELRGTLLMTYWGVPCRFLILFHMPTGAVTIEVSDGA